MSDILSIRLRRAHSCENLTTKEKRREMEESKVTTQPKLQRISLNIRG